MKQMTPPSTADESNAYNKAHLLRAYWARAQRQGTVNPHASQGTGIIAPLYRRGKMWAQKDSHVSKVLAGVSSSTARVPLRETAFRPD